MEKKRRRVDNELVEHVSAMPLEQAGLEELIGGDENSNDVGLLKIVNGDMVTW